MMKDLMTASAIFRPVRPACKAVMKETKKPRYFSKDRDQVLAKMKTILYMEELARKDYVECARAVKQKERHQKKVAAEHKAEVAEGRKRAESRKQAFEDQAPPDIKMAQDAIKGVKHASC